VRSARKTTAAGQRHVSTRPVMPAQNAPVAGRDGWRAATTLFRTGGVGGGKGCCGI
jgi:hypothetical protein